MLATNQAGVNILPYPTNQQGFMGQQHLGQLNYVSQNQPKTIKYNSCSVLAIGIIQMCVSGLMVIFMSAIWIIDASAKYMCGGFICGILVSINTAGNSI